MSYTTLLSSINTALQAQGLTAAPEPRDSDLLNAGRGSFDGSYLITNESGAEPWPELSTNPSNWRATLRLQVGTELTDSAETQSGTVEARARAVYKSLQYATTPVGRCLYNWQKPSQRRAPQSKRLVWEVRFTARWSE